MKIPSTTLSDSKEFVSLRTYRLILFFLLFLSLSFCQKMQAEGSKDFINYPGYRLFLDTRDTQQMKVYVDKDEFINLGSSHLGIQGGFINIYSPDGTLHATLTGNAGNQGIIFNKTQEVAGPTGGGTLGGNGYEPWTHQVEDGQVGVWTIYFGYPTYSSQDFPNLLNSANWTRANNQPKTPRVVLAWDITVTKVKAGNDGGQPVSGRVYTNEYISIINQNGYSTSPAFYILTMDGFVFKVNFMDADPFRFPISSNNIGFATHEIQPIYSSQPRSMVSRSNDPAAWVAGGYYLYEPQAEDYNQGQIVNNKIFFNQPDTNLPGVAAVTDIFRNNKHNTWLYKAPVTSPLSVNGLKLLGNSASNNTCPDNVLEFGQGGYFSFQTNIGGTAILSLDINGDGDFDDPVDRIIYQQVEAGNNLVFWNGKDGLGNPLPVADDLNLRYLIKMKGGETHILLTDVENNKGGVTFELTNSIPGVATDEFYYDHTPIGGGVSGNGTPGNPLPTNTPFTYQNNFGNNKILDYWAFFNYDGESTGILVIDIVDDCNPVPPPPPAGPDKDNDGIPDIVDIDDDNDGVPDAREYCNPGGGFSCLPGGFDPSGDNDQDGVPNFRDADDASFTNPCEDNDADGICDRIAAIYDTDGDGIPDHHDLDSDNDGISDLVEAGHLQPDVDGDGVIDGLPADFGLNGLFNLIASDPDDPQATETYVRFDVDNDGIPDHDDLDSDNDGINDVAEAGYAAADTNNDGRIDDGNGLPPVTGGDGLAPIIDPAITNQPIPLPPDTDGDLVPDWHDLDSDNDLIHDVEEGGNPDPDDDGIIGTGQPAVNADGQATGSGIFPTSKPLDTDHDLVPDYHDLDSDNDGINDVMEADGADPDNDGLPGTGQITVNGQGLPISVNGNPLVTTSQPADTDNDSVRDYRDLDSDNDNINDVAETNKPDNDNNGMVGNGIPVVNANGQSIDFPPTSSPTDSDNDGIPDFREKDSDNDGINDVTEANQPDPDFDGVIGMGIPTVDINGLSDTYLSTSKPTDSDANGIPDFQQLDSDADGILDIEECPGGSPCRDGDGDMTPDFQDPDRDNDGIFDGYECETGFPCPDTDGDGIPDVDDLDTDGDMISDMDECPLGDPCPDVNLNGIPEWREFNCNPGIVVPVAENLTSSVTGICEGSSVTFSAINSVDVEGDSVTYQWIGPNNTEYTSSTSEYGPFTWNLSNLTAQDAGQYRLFLYTMEGCSNGSQTIDLQVVTTPLTPALQAGSPTLCQGQTLELNSQIIQGSNIQYEWWFNDGNGLVSLGLTDVPTFFIPNIDFANTGEYYVSALSNGCPSQLSNAEYVSVDNSLAGMVPNLTIDQDQLCEGHTLELNSSAFGGANIEYHWFFNNGSGNVAIGVSDSPTFFITDVTAANSGNYSVMIVNGNCTSQFSNIRNVIVNNDLNGLAPGLSVDEDQLCSGYTIELNSTPYIGANVQYVWWFDDGTGLQVIATTTIPTLFIPDASPDNSGLYHVSVTVGNCETPLSNAQDITVSDTYLLQTPQLSVLEDTPCEGTFIELNSSVLSGGNVSYNWYFDNGNGPVLLATTNLPTYFIQNVNDSHSGLYMVTASFGNCETQLSNAQDINVTDNLTSQTPTVSATQSTLCEGETLQLNSSVVNGNNILYEWWFKNSTGTASLGTTTVPTFFINNVTTANTGVYSVTFRVGNCVSAYSNSQDVMVTGDLTGQTPTLAINESTLCNGASLELNSSIVNGTNVSYEWFFNDGNGNVSLGVTDIPTFFINGVTAANAGVYTVQASVGNCSSQLSNAQDVTITNALSMAPVLAVDDDQICEGDQLELNSSAVAGSNVAYHWWFDDGTGAVEIGTTNVPTLFLQNTDVTNTGVYSVSVSIGSCASQLSNAQDVVVQPSPDLLVTNTTDDQNLACPGDLIELNASMVIGATYQWFGPQGFSATSPNPVIQNANIKNAGAYYVMVKTAGCDFISEPTSVYVYDQLLAADDDFQLLANDSLTTADWIANDSFGNVAGWEMQIVEQPVHGTISLNANNEFVYHPRERFAGNDHFVYEICNEACPDQCEVAIVSLRIFLDDEDEACFVPNIITPNDDGANDFFNIPCLEDEYRNNNLKIFNRWGDLVYEAQPYRNNWAGTYRNTPLPPGTYFYVLRLDLAEEKCLQGYFTLTR